MTAKLIRQSKWDRRFLQLCDVVASWSEDQSRQVGAVIVGAAHEVRAIGFNGLPRGVKGSAGERHSRDGGEKYFWFEHAERNAIFNAARIGTALEKSFIYTNLFPCADCARAIIQSGIIQLNSYSPPEQDPIFIRSFAIALEMFNEASVEVRLFEKSLDQNP
jgi:dCMP deaminase